MRLVVAFRLIFRVLLISFGWAAILTIGLNVLNNGNVLRSLDDGLYIFLMIFSYFAALFTAFSVYGIISGVSNRLLALFVSAAAFFAIFFVIQSVSVIIFDVVVGPVDNSIDVNHIEVLFPDIDELI